MSLFQTYQSARLYRRTNLPNPERNDHLLATQLIDRLYNGPAGHVSGPFVKQLGLTPENVFERTGVIIGMMLQTIAKDTSVVVN